MAKPKKKYCCICGGLLPRGELGFNPEPVASYSSGTCCVKCYRDKVLFARVKSKTTTNPPMPSAGPLEGDWVVPNKEPL
jgi:hypothetical protein